MSTSLHITADKRLRYASPKLPLATSFIRKPPYTMSVNTIFTFLLLTFSTLLSCNDTIVIFEYENRNPSLYFSEYVEGYNLNKALEIFNGTNSVINLSEYQIYLYYNGSTEPQTIINIYDFLLSPGSVYVIGNSSIERPDLCNQLTGTLLFNGNDVIELRSSGFVIDSIGKLGEFVETSWSVDGISTTDSTLRRKIQVTGGDTISTDNFDPSSEWESYGYNLLDGLGYY